jgi:7-cyano-7-deazaguanine synthase
MCAILGALLLNNRGQRRDDAERYLREMWHWSHERGRDGRGFVQLSDDAHPYRRRDVRRGEQELDHNLLSDRPSDRVAWIANLRAEPTTEYVAEKRADDQQPYSHSGWHIVHNGTVANDQELRSGPRSKYKVDTTIDSAAIVEQLARFQFAPNTKIKNGDFRESFVAFDQVVRKLKGSFAILAVHESEPDMIFVAANYRPIWYCITHVGMFFASSRDYLPGGWPRVMVEPYTVSCFRLRDDGGPEWCGLPLLEQPEPRRALVVCSGGLDSTVAAAWALRNFDEVELAHFLYGSRAEGPESDRVMKIAERLGVGVKFFPMRHLYDPEDSPLLQADSKIAGGEAGAEFAHEWVPARNLVMLAVATAYAEAKGYDTLVLGNNLEEAGAYPDNEPEFIAKFNDLLPFAVGDGKRVRVAMPVGNLMKHEIVELGKQLEAPLDLTWSCYRAGEVHCGTCGPCFMRRTAFKINGFDEVIEYAI